MSRLTPTRLKIALQISPHEQCHRDVIYSGLAWINLTHQTLESAVRQLNILLVRSKFKKWLMAKLITLTTKQKIKDNAEKNRSNSKMGIKAKTAI